MRKNFRAMQAAMCLNMKTLALLPQASPEHKVVAFGLYIYRLGLQPEAASGTGRGGRCHGTGGQPETVTASAGHCQAARSAFGIALSDSTQSSLP